MGPGRGIRPVQTARCFPVARVRRGAVRPLATPFGPQSPGAPQRRDPAPGGGWPRARHARAAALAGGGARRVRNAEYECGILFKKEKDKDRKRKRGSKRRGPHEGPEALDGGSGGQSTPRPPPSASLGRAPVLGRGLGRGVGGRRGEGLARPDSDVRGRVPRAHRPLSCACSGPGRDEHGESPHHQRGASRWVSRAATPRGAPDPPPTAGHRPASPSTLAARCRAPGVLHVPWLSAGGWFVHETTLKLHRARGSS